MVQFVIKWHFRFNRKRHYPCFTIKRLAQRQVKPLLESPVSVPRHADQSQVQLTSGPQLSPQACWAPASAQPASVLNQTQLLPTPTVTQIKCNPVVTVSSSQCPSPASWKFKNKNISLFIIYLLCMEHIPPPVHVSSSLQTRSH